MRLENVIKAQSYIFTYFTQLKILKLSLCIFDLLMNILMQFIHKVKFR